MNEDLSLGTYYIPVFTCITSFNDICVWGVGYLQSPCHGLLGLSEWTASPQPLLLPPFSSFGHSAPASGPLQMWYPQPETLIPLICPWLIPSCYLHITSSEKPFQTIHLPLTLCPLIQWLCFSLLDLVPSEVLYLCLLIFSLTLLKEPLEKRTLSSSLLYHRTVPAWPMVDAL